MSSSGCPDEVAIRTPRSRPLEEGLSIGDAARRTGHTVVTLRHSEKVGLLDAPPRRAGRRRYAPEVIARIGLIDLARAAGFQLAQIRELLVDQESRRTPGERWRPLAARRSAQLDEAAAAIDAMRGLVARLADCRCTSLEECGDRCADIA